MNEKELLELIIQMDAVIKLSTYYRTTSGKDLEEKVSFAIQQYNERF